MKKEKKHETHLNVIEGRNFVIFNHDSGFYDSVSWQSGNDNAVLGMNRKSGQTDECLCSKKLDSAI